jgi:hypothetical protein
MFRQVHPLVTAQLLVLHTIQSWVLLRWDMPMEFHGLRKVLEYLLAALVPQLSDEFQWINLLSI